GRISLAPDSILGVQFSASLRKTFEASMQVTSRLDAEGSYRPSISLAFLKYRPVEDAVLRFGRLANEMYMLGDSADIGYANVTIRQPTIFYPRTFNGGDGEWTQPVSGGLLRVKAFGGRMMDKLDYGTTVYDFSGSLIRGGLFEFVKSGWSGRIASGLRVFERPVTDAPTIAFMQSLQALSPNGAQIANRLSMQGRRVYFRQVALAYDADGWQGMASYAYDVSPGWPLRKTLYSMLSYRVGDWTPYGSYTVQRSDRNFISTGLSSGVGLDALILAAGSAQALSVVNQSSLGIGSRYDITKNTALKVQWALIRYQDPESIVDPSLYSVPAENRHFKDMNLWSAALDFLF
ncbi:MAG TPA: hypothetical protein VFW68_04050, partial [Rhodocyclaceae bacterium]|nr:hypothetical protein [Rhodocyclaceae bacterium]